MTDNGEKPNISCTPPLVGAEVAKFREYVEQGQTTYTIEYARRLLATIEEITNV